METTNNEQLKAFYDLATDTSEAGQEKLNNYIASQSNPNEEAGLRLIVKVAKTTDYESFVQMMTANELPPVELSEEEMELVLGGGAGWWCGYWKARAENSY